jgi:hypothetical protein
MEFGVLLPNNSEHLKYDVPVTIRESGRSSNADAFRQTPDDVNHLSIVQAKAIQRLRLGEGFTTAYAAIALYSAVFIVVKWPKRLVSPSQQ